MRTHLRTLHLEHDPVETEGKPDRRRRLATEFLDEIVVPASTAERVFFPFAVVRPDLEHGRRRRLTRI
jgi:hypothetical protein